MIDFGAIYLFTWENLYYAEVENELGVKALKKLCENQEDSLLSTKNEFDLMVRSEMEKLNPQERGSYYMQIFERDEMVIRTLLRQQRYSLCLSVFSFFEGRLKALCEQIEGRFAYRIKINDLNGNEDLSRYWNYLSKVFELDMDNLEPYFTPIKQQKIIRNLVAHQDGMPRVDQEKKVNIVDGLALEKIDTYSRILITSPSYILNLLDNMDVFLQKLLLSVDERYIAIKGK